MISGKEKEVSSSDCPLENPSVGVDKERIYTLYKQWYY
jgi:hypothetical protein